MCFVNLKDVYPKKLTKPLKIQGILAVDNTIKYTIRRAGPGRERQRMKSTYTDYLIQTTTVNSPKHVFSRQTEETDCYLMEPKKRE